MKTILILAAGVVLVSGPVLAQSNNYNHSWSNYVNQSNDYHYLWGTNCLSLTNTPKAWSNLYAHAYAGTAAGSGAAVQNRFGQSGIPADAQSVVQQFEQERTRLMTQLKTCSDEQRQQILRDMEQLRTQLREQICQLREQAQQQAEQMRNRFGNNRDAILNQGAGSSGAGRDR